MSIQKKKLLRYDLQADIKHMEAATLPKIEKTSAVLHGQRVGKQLGKKEAEAALRRSRICQMPVDTHGRPSARCPMTCSPEPAQSPNTKTIKDCVTQAIAPCIQQLL